MDWVTLIIEIVGLVILVLWITIPIGEFLVIRERLRHAPPRPIETGASKQE